MRSGGRSRKSRSSTAGERGDPAGEKNEASGETSPTILHSSPAEEEDKLGFRVYGVTSPTVAERPVEVELQPHHKLRAGQVASKLSFHFSFLFS